MKGCLFEIGNQIKSNQIITSVCVQRTNKVVFAFSVCAVPLNVTVGQIPRKKWLETDSFGGFPT
jgi:hypothetical protein